MFTLSQGYSLYFYCAALEKHFTQISIEASDFSIPHLQRFENMYHYQSVKRYGMQFTKLQISYLVEK